MQFRTFSSTSIMERITRPIRLVFCAVAGILLVAQLGCRDSNAQNSAIVVEVEKAGAGNDIPSLTTDELKQWFAHQPPLFVHKINNECTPLRTKAPAEWHMRTAEGRVCDAVLPIAALKSVPYGSDHTAY